VGGDEISKPYKGIVRREMREGTWRKVVRSEFGGGSQVE
jgi:hypothetical protein